MNSHHFKNVLFHPQLTLQKLSTIPPLYLYFTFMDDPFNKNINFSIVVIRSRAINYAIKTFSLQLFCFAWPTNWSGAACLKELIVNRLCGFLHGSSDLRIKSILLETNNGKKTKHGNSTSNANKYPVFQGFSLQA